MIRRIIHIDEGKCDGCGLCATACHEGAIAIVDGKARLLREDYCDGLGDCLPACPRKAISFEEREAPAYDHAAVLTAQKAKAHEKAPIAVRPRSVPRTGRLTNWPVQIKLAPETSAVYAEADLLIAADCTAFACPDLHDRYIRGRITLIGCPKLDSVPYAEKLSRIFALNDIRTITVLRMTVPCCGGLPMAVKKAVELSGKNIPVNVVVLDTDGKPVA